MHKIVRLLRVLFENLFINYKKYDKSFKLDTNNTVMDFNIRCDHFRVKEYNWIYRRIPIIEMIKDKKPSFICLQEVHSHMFKWLHKKLFNQYDYIECCGDKQHKSLLKTFNWLVNGMVLWYDKSKYTLKEYKIVPDDSNPEKFLLIGHFLDKEGQMVTVINTHYDCLYQSRRIAFTLKLNEELGQISNDIYLCGDFNTDIKSEEIRSINLPFKVPFENETQRTFNHYDDTWGIIDFIMSNKEIKSYEIVTKDYGIKYISDHYPIIVQLS